MGTTSGDKGMQLVESRSEWRACAWIFALAFLLFVPALQNGFVNWDDNRFIVENQNIRAFAWDNLVAMFTGFVDGNYIPLTQLSFALNHAIHGLQPAGYHATNMLLHALNACLVFLLLRRLGGATVASAVGAVLFAIHPLRVESVAWATERKDVLFAVFYLLALHAYLRFLDTRSWKPYAITLGCFVLSGLSKQMAISLPVILLVLDFARKRTLSWGMILEKIPFGVIALGFVAVAFFGQHSSESILRGTQYTPIHRLLLSCNSLVMYMKGILWPMELSCIYPYPRDVVAEAAYTPFVIAIVAGLILWRGRAFHPLWIGAAFFLISLAPVLNVVPAGSQMVADRFTYLPAVGISYVLVMGLTESWARLGERGRQVLITIGTIVFVLCAILTWNRIKVWKSDLALWNDAVRKAPHAFVAHSNLALAHLNAGNLVMAVDGFTRAIAISPQIADSYNNRGMAYRKQKKVKEALADFTMATTLEPTKAAYWYNRAETYYDEGQCERAIPDYSRVIELEPDMDDARMARGVCLGMQGDFKGAMEDFAKLIQDDPGNLDARFNLGKAQYAVGDIDGALAGFTTIVERDPTYAKALYHRAVILIQMNRFEEAWRDVRNVQALGFSVPEEDIRKIPAHVRATR